MLRMDLLSFDPNPQNAVGKTAVGSRMFPIDRSVKLLPSLTKLPKTLQGTVLCHRNAVLGHAKLCRDLLRRAVLESLAGPNGGLLRQPRHARIARRPVRLTSGTALNRPRKNRV